MNDLVWGRIRVTIGYHASPVWPWGGRADAPVYDCPPPPPAKNKKAPPGFSTAEMELFEFPTAAENGLCAPNTFSIPRKGYAALERIGWRWWNSDLMAAFRRIGAGWKMARPAFSCMAGTVCRWLEWPPRTRLGLSGHVTSSSVVQASSACCWKAHPGRGGKTSLFSFFEGNHKRQIDVEASICIALPLAALVNSTVPLRIVPGGAEIIWPIGRPGRTS